MALTKAQLDAVKKTLMVGGMIGAVCATISIFLYWYEEKLRLEGKLPIGGD